MIRCTAILAAVLSVTLLTHTEASAQAGELSLEFRGGYNFPMGDFDDSGAESQFGFGADMIVSLNPALSVYGGWGRDQFDCENCGDDDSYHSQGFEAGMKLLAPREEGMLPWIRAGAIFHDLSGEIGGVEFDSDNGFGFQGSVGVDIPLTHSFSVSPALRFQSWTAEFSGPLNAFQAEQDVRYLSLDVAAHIHFR